jgi:hypothetical protein
MEHDASKPAVAAQRCGSKDALLHLLSARSAIGANFLVRAARQYVASSRHRD